MLFGAMGWLGLRMEQVVGLAIAPQQVAILEVGVGHSIVTSGAFIA